MSESHKNRHPDSLENTRTSPDGNPLVKGKRVRILDTIFEERARLLAQQGGSRREAMGSGASFITFRSTHDKFAVPIHSVAEIQPSREMSMVPHIPPFFIGAVNIRGNIILVFNIASFLSLPEQGVADFSHIIVIKSGAVLRGIVGRDVNKEELHTGAGSDGSKLHVSDRNRRFINSVATDLSLILNVNEILADRRICLNTEQ